MSVETIKAEKLMTRHLERCSNPSILRVEGSLRAPMHHELARRVEALLDRGERRLVLDLARLSEIDAAGVGELVEAFNRTSAAGGILRIAHASRRVRTLLDLTGVSKLLSADPLANPLSVSSGSGNICRGTAPSIQPAAAVSGISLREAAQHAGKRSDGRLRPLAARVARARARAQPR